MCRETYVSTGVRCLLLFIIKILTQCFKEIKVSCQLLGILSVGVRIAALLGQCMTPMLCFFSHSLVGMEGCLGVFAIPADEKKPSSPMTCSIKPSVTSRLCFKIVYVAILSSSVNEITKQMNDKQFPPNQDLGVKF